MKSTTGVAVVVVSPMEDHNERVNTALRESGHAARCQRINDTGELGAAIGRFDPHLVVLFASHDELALERAAALCGRDGTGAAIPLLVVADSADEPAIAATLRAGARDLVTLENMVRFKAVAGRELRHGSIERSLERVMSSARQFKNELHSLKQVSVEAIADVQEGIIVNTNPAWLELFGHNADADLTGTPIMDICSKTDQPALKGGIVACQRGKWLDDVLEVRGITASGAEITVAFCLENVEHDGEPAVRMLVKPDTSAEQPPAELLADTLRRDHVTGFYTRQHFAESATARLGEAAMGGVRAIAYVRIDRFSRVSNDVGIIGTDAVLAQFAQCLREFTQPTDIYGRLGGTMYAVMLERGTMADVEAWAGKFAGRIAATDFAADTRSTVMTCSVGISEISGGDDALDRAVNAAERACRAARQKGGNNIEFSQDTDGAPQDRENDSQWVPRIRNALMDNRFRLEHQPVAGLNKEIDEAYDILVRMLDEEGNTVLPRDFMPVAERTGLSKNIDRWVIGAALSFLLTNPAELLFVRLSRNSVLDETLVAWLKSQLARTGVTAQRVCFEMDEAVAATNLSRARKLVEELRACEFRVAIEHFGRHADGDDVLQHVRMDFVKIDGSLMQGLHKDAETQEQVRNIVALARSAGCDTVAERVQDANTMAVLWQLGVSYIQGNYVQKSEIVIEDTSQSTVTTRALQLQA